MPPKCLHLFVCWLKSTGTDAFVCPGSASEKSTASWSSGSQVRRAIIEFFSFLPLQVELSGLGLERWGERPHPLAGASQASRHWRSRASQSTFKACRLTHTFHGCRGGLPWQEEAGSGSRERHFWCAEYARVPTGKEEGLVRLQRVTFKDLPST